MRNRLIFSAAAVVAMLALSPAPRGQDAAHPGSVPDISGVWLVEKFEPRLFPNGGAPLQPWAEMKLKTTNPQTDDPNLACLDSVGKWEGDTLVVDTIGFNDKTWLDGGALPHTEALHVVERIHRRNHDTLVDEFTIEDPMAYTKPITAQQVYKLKPDWEIHEYVCEENNKYTYQRK